MLAKRFFYVSAALFLLALTYHLGARNAGAQAPGNPVVGIAGTSGFMLAVTCDGDSYATVDDGISWHRTTNIFGNGPTSAVPQTWGQVKDRYRK